MVLVPGLEHAGVWHQSRRPRLLQFPGFMEEMDTVGTSWHIIYQCISVYIIYLSYQILAHTSHTFLCLPSFGLANQFGFLQPFAINAPPCSSHPAWSSARFKLRCPKSFLKSALETIPVGLSYNSFCCPRLRDRKRDKWK